MAPSARIRTHSTQDCDGHPCPIHAPSDHHMRDWPLHWRDDRRLMERVCKHGVGHPDPDHIARTRRLRGDDEADAEAVHGCCGCCATPDGDESDE